MHQCVRAVTTRRLVKYCGVYKLARSKRALVQVSHSKPSQIGLHAGEAIVFCGAALLNTLAFVIDGWPCKKFNLRSCLETSNMIPALSLIAATVQTVSLLSDPYSNSAQRLLFVSKVLICLVANLELFIIFTYYSHLTVCF